MLARELLAQFRTSAVSAMELIDSFLKTYTSWNWATSEVEVPDITRGVYRRNDKEPMVILSINRPIINVSSSVTHSTLSAISSEFSQAFKQLQSGTSWNHICEGVGETPARDFLSRSAAYVRIEVNHWGRNGQQGSSLAGYVESRLVLVWGHCELIRDS
jgi:poly(A) polymerase Pap1